MPDTVWVTMIVSSSVPWGEYGAKVTSRVPDVPPPAVAEVGVLVLGDGVVRPSVRGAEEVEPA